MVNINTLYGGKVQKKETLKIKKYSKSDFQKPSKKTELFLNDNLQSNKGELWRIRKIDSKNITVTKQNSGNTVTMPFKDIKDSFNIKNPVVGK
ncbi:MAG: hypothetical protein ACTSRG_22650 [Candidatus Helarchaeota archaeon]